MLKRKDNQRENGTSYNGGVTNDKRNLVITKWTNKRIFTYLSTKISLVMVAARLEGSIQDTV